MASSYWFLASVLLCFPLESHLQKNGFKDIVPSSIQQCCSDRIASDKCPYISGAVKGKGTTFYVFHQHLFTEFSGIASNGYPIMASAPKPIDSAWKGMNTRIFPIMASFQYKKEIYVKLSLSYSVYDMDRNKLKIVLLPCVGTEAPLFCPKTGFKGSLIAAIVTSRGPDALPLIKAWYRKDRLDDVDVRIYEGIDGKKSVFESKDEAKFLTQSAVVFDESQKYNLSYGFDFIADRRVLPFVLPFGELNLRKYETWTRHPGHGMQIFVGCPPPFCYNSDIDDGRVVADKGRPVRLILYRGQYYWEIEVGNKLPLKMPTAADARLIDDHLLPQHPSHIDAAVSLEDSQGQHVLVSKDTELWVYKNAKLVTKTTLSLFFGFTTSVPFLDAFWYNRVEAKIYLFEGNRYWVSVYKNNKWTLEERSIGDFKGIVPDIDGAFTIKDFGYIFRGNWFYKIPEKSWKTAAIPFGCLLSLGSSAASSGFFATKEGCKFSTKEFDDLRHLMHKQYRPKDTRGKNPRDPQPTRPLRPSSVGTGSGTTIARGSSKATKENVKDKDGSRKWPYIAILVIVFGLILFGSLFFVLFGKKTKTPKEKSLPPVRSKDGLFIDSTEHSESRSRSSDGSKISSKSDL